MIPQAQTKLGLAAGSTPITTLLLAGVYAPFTAWMPPWVTGCFLAILFLGYLADRRGQLPLPRGYRILAALGGLAAVTAQWGAPVGLEAGTALLFIMLALKTLEQSSSGEQTAILLLCFFPLLAGTLFSQSLPLFFYDLLLLWAVLAVLQKRHARIPQTRALTRSGSLLLASLPLAICLFMFFPRTGSGFLSLPGESTTAVSGIPRALSPGDISRLISSQEIAFRAKFHNRTPQREELYWRVKVFDRFDGSRWSPARILDLPPPEIRPSGRITEYSIDLEPTGRHYLPCLQLPTKTPEESRIQRGYLLRREQEVTSRIQYRLASATGYTTGSPPRASLEAALGTREGANPRTRELVSRLQQETEGTRELIRAAMNRFGEGNYTYTREPPRIQGSHAVDRFLFETRQGFCGHYAQALAWMAREAGIPARIVAGYSGGEKNPLGDYWIVRQSHAHAWVEVHIPGSGWVSRDPTSVLSRDQIAFLGGDESGRQGTAEAGARERSWLSRMLHQAELAWDAARFGWSYWVLGFTQQRQLELLADLRLGENMEKAFSRAVILLTSFFLVFMLVIAAILLLRGKSKDQDEAALALRRFRRKLDKAGIYHPPGEGPLALARRIETQRPDLAPACRAILDKYTGLRYAGNQDPGGVKELKRLIRRFSPTRGKG